MTTLATPVTPPGSFLEAGANRMSPIPSGEDAARRDRIQHLLHDQQRPELREILITSEGGTVTLQGKVSSFYLRQLCILCCQQAVGVFRINDLLQVGTA